MNSCPEKDTLNLYFLNLLDEKDKIEIEEHLKFCTRCYKEYLIEKEIKNSVILKREIPEIEEILIKKIKLYGNDYEFSPILKFFRIFLTSTAIISTFFAFYLIILNFLWKNLYLFKSQKSKAILMLFSLYL